jgi:hypothetical protein
MALKKAAHATRSFALQLLCYSIGRQFVRRTEHAAAKSRAKFRNFDVEFPTSS